MSKSVNAWKNDIKIGFSKTVVVKYAKNHLEALRNLLSEDKTNAELLEILDEITQVKDFLKEQA